MRNYIGNVRVQARPMNLESYRNAKGLPAPAVAKEGRRSGYLVHSMPDQGAEPVEEVSESWMCTRDFRGTFRPSTRMTLGEAIEAIRAGKNVKRISTPSLVYLMGEAVDGNEILVFHPKSGSDEDTSIAHFDGAEVLAEDWKLA